MGKYKMDLEVGDVEQQSTSVYVCIRYTCVACKRTMLIYTISNIMLPTRMNDYGNYII